MDSKLDQLKSFICLRDKSGEVLYQNKPCQSVCGKMQGQKCTQGCMHFRKANKDGRPWSHVGKRLVSSEVYDLAFLTEAEIEISILCPVAAFEIEKKSFAELSPREQEIHDLQTRHGLSASDIAKRLFISRSTVKTHLNNIAKKHKPQT